MTSALPVKHICALHNKRLPGHDTLFFLVLTVASLARSHDMNISNVRMLHRSIRIVWYR